MSSDVHMLAAQELARNLLEATLLFPANRRDELQAHRRTFCVWHKLFDKLGWWNEIVEDLE
jgi:hypothetical protein